MYKQLRFLTTMLLLAVCCGTWAQETLFYTLTPTAGTNNSYTGNCDITINGITWNVSGNSQMQPWRIGGKSITGVNRTVYSKTAMGSAISKVELTVGAASSITVNSLKLTVASDASFTNTIDEVSATFAANSTISFTPTSGTEWATGAYYKFTFNVTVSGSSNKFVEFTEAKFYKLSNGEEPTPTVAAPTFSPAAGEVDYGTNITLTQANAHAIVFTTNGDTPSWNNNVGTIYSNTQKPVIQSDMTVKAIAVAQDGDNFIESEVVSATYTVKRPAAPTFSPAAGAVEAGTQVTISGTGRIIVYTTDGSTPSYGDHGEVYTDPITVNEAMTIKAIVVDSHDFESEVSTASYTIYDPNAPGTENNPYTVAQARAAIDANTGITGVYATGIVSEIVTAYNSQYGNITYNISADGTTTADQLEVYRGKSYNGDNFTSEDDVQVGDVVVIYGNLKKYNSTYEFDANSKLVSLDRPVITTPSISLSETTIDATADGAEGTIDVTYNNITDVVAQVVFYEEDGETTTAYDWITADINNDNNVEYIIEANTGAARTAYMKVYALDDETNDVYSELITITQAEYVEAINYTLASSITSGKHYIIVGSSTMADYAMGVQNNNNRAAVEIEISGETVTVASEDVHEVQICGPDANGFYTINDGGYLYAASSGSNYLRTEETLDDNGRWSITFGDEGVANIVAQGTNTRNTMQFNASNHIFACYASASQGKVYLYEKADEATPTQTVSISSAGLATFCSENALDFTGITDVWAYIAKNENGNVTYKRVQRVPARTGVLLRNKLESGAISCDVPTLEGTTKDDVSDNKFIGTLTDINALASVVETNTNYILNNGANGVGFYKANGKKVGAGKAYLQLPTEGAKTFIGFDEEGEATAISTIDNGQLTMDNAYNLQGQKVGSEYKGIVIVNGKKFINK